MAKPAARTQQQQHATPVPVDTATLANATEPNRMADLEARVMVLERQLQLAQGGACPQQLSPRLPQGDAGLVYVGMAAETLHHGHINILIAASKLGGRVVVGLLTDDAISAYRRKPTLSWEQRKQVVQALRYVDIIVPQHTLDYSSNLSLLRPAFVVHGDDWSRPDSAQYSARQTVVAKLAEWGG